MKQVRIYIALLCTLLLAAGCSKEMETETATTSPTDVASLIKIGDFPAFDQGADTRATGTPDPGKTTWADGDKVLLKIQLKHETAEVGSPQCFTLTYSGTTPQWTADKSLNLPDYRATSADITAYYAPTFEWGATNTGTPTLISGKQAGTDEFLTYTATGIVLSDGIDINFSGTRPYSRLRIVTQPGATIQFSPSNGSFIPADSTAALSDAAPRSATADAEGNAFFYGSWSSWGGTFYFDVTAPSKLLRIEKKITESSVDGNSYVVDATKLLPVASMSMTIDTRKNTENPSDATFILPIKNEAISGYRLFVDWGDGKTSVFNAGTTPSAGDMAHTYPQAGEYTITISSTQTTPANQQMPIFDFSADESNSNRSKLTSLNTPLLNMGGTSFEGLFKNCTNLTTIPSELFDNNTGVTTFKDCFLICTGLTAIPAGLFDKNTGVTTFESCFSGCKGLTAIPAGLFDKNTGVTTFGYCFSYCTGLTAIPEKLFDKNTGVTTFENCFSQCTELTTIPAGLFDNNTGVKTFGYCFYQCTGLTAIPEKLFDNNTEVTTFEYCFSQCTGLTAIPSGLFDKNIGVTTFEYCFFDCKGLTKIPEMLFAENIAATNFNSCFANCFKVALNSNIFCDETTAKDSRFEGKVVDFSYCFTWCGYEANESGTAPALWDYTMGAGSIEKGCFQRVTKVTNAGVIPGTWQ